MSANNWEQLERMLLSPKAALTSQSRGRRIPEEPCPIRTCYQRDRDRIIHSKSFRRLKQKTQVFIAPEGDHFRTRMTHTLEVAQISRTVARALLLNEDLTEAISLGHDLGHTPFGHCGERALQELMPAFSHNRQSLRVVDVLEKDGMGLNLSWEVRNGILHHCGDTLPETLEGQIVRICDRVAYINHDIDDAIRAGIINPSRLPVASAKLLGRTHSQRIGSMVRDIIEVSRDQDRIAMSDAVQEATDELRSFLFCNVYCRPEAKEDEEKLHVLVKDLYQYYLAHPEELPESAARDNEQYSIAVCDYIAGMSDRFALTQYKNIFDKEIELVSCV